MTSPHDQEPAGASADAPADAEVTGEAVDTSSAADMVEEGAPVASDDQADDAEPSADPDPLAVAQRELEERTADLQRLQAEFLNYKRRVERDRELLKENATYSALSPITEVLDTIDRAREHGELDEGLRAVAEQLEQVVARQGLVRYGAPGDEFDPNFHDALSHVGEDPEVTVTTCKVIVKSGYRIGERVVRAAQVLVVDPAAPAADSGEPASDQG